MTRARDISQLLPNVSDPFSVKDDAYGAAGDGVTDDTAAIQAAFTAAGSNSIVLFPPGQYKMTSGPVTITGDNVTIYAYGAVIDCDGGDGFHLTGDDQTGVSLLGMHVKDFAPVGFGIPNNGSQDEVLKTHITVRDCKFTDSTTTGQYLLGVKLSCETYGVKIVNNHIENLISTSTASGGWVYGVIVGKKSDSLGGDRTGALGGYGYDGTIGNAEGSTIITGNTIRKLRGSGGMNTDAVTAILADGWRCIISNNVVEDIQYIGAGAYGASGTGIYARGFEGVISGNAVADCTTDQVTVKQSSSVTYGDTGQYVITGNTFRTLTALSNTEAAAASIVGVYVGNVLIKDNFFSKCVVKAGYLINNATTSDKVFIDGNVFEAPTCNAVALLLGSHQHFTNNTVINPIGNYAAGSGYVMVTYYTGSAAKNVLIENNTQTILESTFRGGGQSYGLTFNADAAVSGLTVRNNRFFGWSGATPAETWRLLNLNVTVAGHLNWDISGNQTDAAWRTVDYYNDVNISGGGAVPTYLRQTWDFLGPITASAAGGITIIDDESGATFANVGAAAGWSYVLPVSLPGMEFGFSKVVNQAMTVDPNGSEIINAGSAGGILTLTNVGSSVYLKCFVAGTWIVTTSNGAYTVA